LRRTNEATRDTATVTEQSSAATTICSSR
jgi:hypothetical protein